MLNKYFLSVVGMFSFTALAPGGSTSSGRGFPLGLFDKQLYTENLNNEGSSLHILILQDYPFGRFHHSV